MATCAASEANLEVFLAGRMEGFSQPQPPSGDFSLSMGEAQWLSDEESHKGPGTRAVPSTAMPSVYGVYM